MGLRHELWNRDGCISQLVWEADDRASTRSGAARDARSVWAQQELLDRVQQRRTEESVGTAGKMPGELGRIPCARPPSRSI
jgi:hypothetical protein